MKCISFSAAVAALLLCGCAAPSGDNASTRQEAHEQGEYTVGSLFPKKNRQRVAAENDNAPSSATLNIETMQSR